MESGRKLIPRALGGRFWPRAWTVQRKMVAATVLPLLLVVPILTGFLWLYGNSTYDSILTNKVRSDLATAQQYLIRLEESQTQRLQGYADSQSMARAYREQGIRGIESLLPTMRTGARLSYLTFHPVESLKKPALAPLLDATHTVGVRSGLILLSSAALSVHTPELGGATRIPIIPTAAAAPDDRAVLTDNLVMQSLVRVNVEGRWVGVLEGGSVLNRDLSLVDSINDLVYPIGALLPDSRGTVTVFLDDVRIATNVQTVDGTRAIGTRVSAAVKEKVLGRGEPWYDNAFVVNDWYVSGYAPLQDVGGNRVGMLYVGFLEAPYRALKERVLLLLLLAAGLSTVFSVWLATQLARGVFDPLFRMNYTMSRVESGDKAARVGPMGRQDEFGELADHFDRLLDKLAARQAELEKLNADLDSKVNERTADLVQANQMLRAAQDQMIASERLATIGQLTAGVAHEVNNPLAVMQGHLDLLREALVNGDNIDREIRLLDDQVQRMRQIVQKLLQFVRPETFVGYVDELDVEEAVRDALVLVEQELRQSRIHPALQLAPGLRVAISRIELQQVLVNLLINATHAASDQPDKRGVSPAVWLQTQAVVWEGQEAVEIIVENNGPAIPAEQQALIFELFYTTKRAVGNGLGLPISRMLLQRYGGALDVESPVIAPQDPQACPAAAGARFTVRLLRQPRFSSDMIRQAISMTGHQP